MAKGHLLVAAIPPLKHMGMDDGPKDGDEDTGGQVDDSEDDGGERDAFDGFADAAGIPDDKRDDAFAALKDMIHICYANSEKEEPEGEK
jgi:hypothetical protein